MSLVLFPVEIQSLILSKLSDSDIFRISQYEPFSDLCDWLFWRQRAMDKFKVPKAYFDLTLERDVSGAYRYLEILSKFESTEEALASIDNGLVSGIYTPEELFYRASMENNVQLMKKIHSQFEIHFDLSDGLHYNESYALMTAETMDFLYELDINATNKFFKIEENYEEYKSEQRAFVQAIDSDQWEGMDKYLISERSETFLLRLFSLVHCKKVGAFEILKLYYPKLDGKLKESLIRAMIQNGREEEVNWMSKFLPEFFLPNRNFCPSNAAGDRIWWICDNYNPLIDAYFGGNLNLVQRFKDLGYDSNLVDKPGLIIRGYKQRCSNPIDVYYLVKHELGLEIIVGWLYSRWEFYEIDDIEINSLTDNDWNQTLDFGGIVEGIINYGTCNNLNFLHRYVSIYSKEMTVGDEIINYDKNFYERKNVDPMAKQLIASY